MPERGTFGVGESCYRYSPRLGGENNEVADLLIGLTNARKTWGFGLCFLYLRNVQGRVWNHKRVCRITCELELNLRPLGTLLRNALPGNRSSPASG